MSKIVNDKGAVEYLTAERIVARLREAELARLVRSFADPGPIARLMGSASVLALEAGA